VDARIKEPSDQTDRLPAQHASMHASVAWQPSPAVALRAPCLPIIPPPCSNSVRRRSFEPRRAARGGGHGGGTGERMSDAVLP
jgi:hypothetical protein